MKYITNLSLSVWVVLLGLSAGTLSSNATANDATHHLVGASLGYVPKNLKLKMVNMMRVIPSLSIYITAICSMSILALKQVI